MIENSELLINRILSGLTIIDDYIIKSPPTIEKYRACILYNQIVSKNICSEWMSRENMEQYLINNRLLDQNYKKELDDLHKSIDNTKLDMFNALPNLGTIKLLRQKLKSQQSAIESINNILHGLDRFTIEGYAEIVKYQYIISHSIYDMYNNKINVDRKTLESIITKLAEESISISEYRELSRTEPWRSYWGASKENVFGIPAKDYTDEQKTLVLFSKMYDNAYKHPECPNDMVINDDDLFDGWSIYQSRQNNKKTDPKTDNASEVFVMTKDPKTGERIVDPKSVFESNTFENKQIIKQRAEALKNSKGKIKEADLPDVKKELQMETNRLFMQQKKGKKG